MHRRTTKTPSTIHMLCALLLSGVAAMLSTPLHAAEAPMQLRLSEQLRFPGARPPLAPAPASHLQLRLERTARRSIIRRLVLRKGEAMLGTEYVYGANRADAVDCSSLVQQMFGNAGIQLPRTTGELVSIGRPVSSADLQPGDLLFYRWRRQGLHVVVYLAGNRILHASAGHKEVVITELNGGWRRHLVGVRRPI